ncbi:MAG: YHS domain-containing protein [Armatimonadota bacterium]|nr:YHS domain-containing protein [Armatimonadota bacterium]MDR7426485.1 YHS domain-containing protein [Armatimonadota bacterium]MDR7463382.1 YHS domain-containing protein [Armatimonadota bacterium]MDR7468563.1 YHS domain-containing protein [Armatimonadota bacterium]MDR7475156.1 YHS domain-containing protein [Armatimonadota bacterium]
MAIDPVCGMTVEEQKAAGSSEYRGQTYYFCSSGCKAAFDKEPERYVGHGSHQPGHGH